MDILAWAQLWKRAKSASHQDRPLLPYRGAWSRLQLYRGQVSTMTHLLPRSGDECDESAEIFCEVGWIRLHFAPENVLPPFSVSWRVCGVPFNPCRHRNVSTAPLLRRPGHLERKDLLKPNIEASLTGVTCHLDGHQNVISSGCDFIFSWFIVDTDFQSIMTPSPSPLLVLIHVDWWCLWWFLILGKGSKLLSMMVADRRGWYSSTW